jgi:hypothetical protein
VASYAALLLGLLARDSVNRQLIQQQLPNQTFVGLIQTIEEFIVFQAQNAILSKEAHQALVNVITSLEEQLKVSSVT